MNSQLKRAPLQTVDRETVAHPVSNVGVPVRVCCPKRDISNESGPQLTKDTQVLLRLRLRAAAFNLTCANLLEAAHADCT